MLIFKHRLTATRYARVDVDPRPQVRSSKAPSYNLPVNRHDCHGSRPSIPNIHCDPYRPSVAAARQ
jgi:hypothetical protein